MALYIYKETFLSDLKEHGVKGLSELNGVTHGAIMHYKRKWDENRKVKNPITYVEHGGVVTGKDVYGREFMFDADDLEKVIKYNWYVHQNYVKAMDGKRVLLLHRVILDCSENLVVDHINHNRHDNRKINLRAVTRSQNIQNRGIIPNNTSGVTGVHWHKHTKKWKAQIEVNKRKIYIGVFKEKEDAIKARKEAEVKYFGEYAFKEQVEG